MNERTNKDNHWLKFYEHEFVTTNSFVSYVFYYLIFYIKMKLLKIGTLFTCLLLPGFANSSEPEILSDQRSGCCKCHAKGNEDRSQYSRICLPRKNIKSKCPLMCLWAHSGQFLCAMPRASSKKMTWTHTVWIVSPQNEPHWGAMYSGDVAAVNHGSPWVYDIYVSIMFAGWDIPALKVRRQVETVDIAPTLSLLLGAKSPSGSVGEPLIEVFK